MSKPNLPPLPDLRGDVVNEAFWKCINSTRHTLPSYIVDDLKPAIYAALCHVLPIYAEEAVRQALEQAAVKALEKLKDLTTEMEGYSYFGSNPGVKEDDYEDVAEAIRALIPEKDHG